MVRFFICEQILQIIIIPIIFLAKKPFSPIINTFIQLERRHLMKKGFTLIEVLIVITILGILVFVFTQNNQNETADADSKKNNLNKRMLERSILLHDQDYNTLPISEKAIDAEKITPEFKVNMMNKFQSLGESLTESDWDTMLTHFKKLDNQKLKQFIRGYKENEDYFVVDFDAPYFPGYLFSYKPLYSTKKTKEIFEIPYEGSLPPKPPSIMDLQGANIGVGGYFTSYLNSKGHVYVWGSNMNKEFGGSTNILPVQKEGGGNLDNVIQMYTGGSHSFAITKDGKLYGWGRNDLGNLGLGTTTTLNYAKELVLPDNLKLKHVKKLSTNYNNSLLLLESGEVLSWGENQTGQLGTGNTNKQTSPTYLIKSDGTRFTNVKDVLMGENSAYILEKDGTMYVAGDNSQGQLAIGDYRLIQQKFIISNELSSHGKNITKMGAGAYHFAALLEDGKVITLGSNSFGQLANPGGNNASPRFAKDGSGNDFTGAKDIAVGRYHVISLKESGDIYGWGMNDYGQLGFADAAKRTQATLLPGWKADKIDANYYQTTFSQGKNTYFLGMNTDHQINSSGSFAITSPYLIDSTSLETLQ